MYGPQQSLYRLALERITGIPVGECLLYSLHDDLAIRLDLPDENGKEGNS